MTVPADIPQECAFVNYTSVEEARTCLETLNGYQLGSMTVTLDYGRRDAASHPDAVGEKVRLVLVDPRDNNFFSHPPRPASDRRPAP